MRRPFAVPAILALLFLLVACGRPGGTDGPEGAAERWLAALAGAEEDRGLSLLAGLGTDDPDGSSGDRYVAAAAATDWDAAGLEVQTVRPLSSSSYSVSVLAHGPIPAVFAEFGLAGPVCDGDRVAGIRFDLIVPDDATYLVAPRWDGIGGDAWSCDADEFTTGPPAAFGDGLSFMNNTELPVSVTNALGRDLEVLPCTTQTFREFPGPLTLSTSLGPLGTTNGSVDPQVGTRFIVVGDREIYDELGPPVDPWPQCGGEPPLQGS
jgi:hypothetical protein